MATTAFRLRPARDADRPLIAALHAASWKDTYRALLPPEFLSRAVDIYMTRRWAAEQVGARDVLLVAEGEAGGLAGFIAAWVQGEVGFIDNLHVAAGGRSQGLGRALLGEAARRMLAQGMTSAYLHVLTGNVRARSLYLQLGGELGDEFDDMLDGNPVPAQRIDWPDLRVLAERAGA